MGILSSSIGKIGELLKKAVPDLIVDYLGFKGMRNIFFKKKDQEEERKGVKNAAGPGEKLPEVHLGGLFGTADEAGVMSIFARSKQDDAMKRLVKRACIELNKLEPWQRRKFREAMAQLARIDYVKETRKEPKTTKRYGKGKETVIEEKVTEVKGNLGVEFLEALVKHDAEGIKALCKTVGVMDSDLEPVTEEMKRIKKWLEENEATLVWGIHFLTMSVSQRSYQGFWKELVSFRN